MASNTFINEKLNINKVDLLALNSYIHTNHGETKSSNKLSNGLKIIGAKKGKTIFWEVDDDGNSSQTCQNNNLLILSMLVLNKKSYACGTNCGKLIIYSLKNNKPIKTFDNSHKSIEYILKFSKSTIAASSRWSIDIIDYIRGFLLVIIEKHGFFHQTIKLNKNSIVAQDLSENSFKIVIWKFNEISIINEYTKLYTVRETECLVKLQSDQIALNNNSNIDILDLNARQVLFTLTGHKSYVTCLANSNVDTKLLASGGRDNRIMIWDLSIQKCIKVFDLGISNEIYLVKSHHKLFACSLNNKFVNLHDLNTGELLDSLREENSDLIRCMIIV